MISERYVKNSGILTDKELRALSEKRVFVAGCGGLGGYVLEMLARLGVLHITAVDGDVFSASNLNRQILSTENNIGMYKTEAALLRIKEINSEVELCAIPVYIDEKNAPELLKGHDVIIDALDNVPARLLLEEQAENLNIPLVHGAVQNLFIQVAVVMPGDRTLKKMYRECESPSPSVPPFTPALCASLQVSETVKLLCRKTHLAKGQLLTLDLYDNSMNVFNF